MITYNNNNNNNLIVIVMVIIIIIIITIIITIPLFTLGSVYSTNASGTEQMPGRGRKSKAKVVNTAFAYQFTWGCQFMANAVFTVFALDLSFTIPCAHKSHVGDLHIIRFRFRFSLFLHHICTG